MDNIVRSLWVHHRERIRQFGSRFVVIGHDQVDPHITSAFCGLEGGDPAIARYYQACPSRRDLVDRGRLDIVAISLAMGKPILHVALEGAQGPHEQGSAGDAVYIVVSVDAYPLAAFDGGRHPVHAGLQVRKQKWVVKLIERWLEEPARGLSGSYPAVQEKTSR